MANTIRKTTLDLTGVTLIYIWKLNLLDSMEGAKE